MAGTSGRKVGPKTKAPAPSFGPNRPLTVSSYDLCTRTWLRVLICH